MRWQRSMTARSSSTPRHTTMRMRGAAGSSICVPLGWRLPQLPGTVTRSAALLFRSPADSRATPALPGTREWRGRRVVVSARTVPRPRHN